MRWAACRRWSAAAFVAAVMILAPATIADRSEVKLAPSELRGGGGFGLAADLDAETAVVAGYGTTRAKVFVFVRGEGAWLEQQALTGDDALSSFGQAVAVDGDTLVATAPNEEIAGERTGAAYVFVRTGETWTREDKLEPSDPQTSAHYGYSVDIDGDTIVVGDYRHDDTYTDQGVAYVYTRSGETWTEEQRLTANDAAQADYFGRGVAIEGDTIIVGANADDPRGNGSGSAYVFQRTEGVWQQHAKVIDANGGVEAGFGFTVAMTTDWVMIAAPYNDANGFSSGSVFAWSREQQSIAREQEITAPAFRAQENFGRSLAIHGERLLVGAPGYDGLGINTGRAYLYEYDGVEWLHSETIDQPDADVWEVFGQNVGLTEHVMLIASQFADDPDPDSGEAWIFDDTPAVKTKKSSLIPSKVAASLPAKTKKAQTPGLTAKGILDTGPDAVDLTAGGTLHVGTAEFVVPNMTRAANGRTYTHEDAEVDFTIQAPKDGGSRCTFKLAIEADLTGHVDPNGPLTLAYGSGAIDATATVVLDGGKFKLSSSPDTLGTEVLHCVKAKAKLKGDGRDVFKLKLRFGSDGTPPAAAPVVTVEFGDAFEAVLDQAKFKMKKSKWTFSDPKAAGVTKAVLDFGKGQAVITAKKATLGAFPQGATPLTILLGVDDDLRAVELRAVVKGKTLKY